MIPGEPILVTGATGYIASRLIPRLLEGGAVVRAMVRSPHKLSVHRWSSGVQVACADVLQPATLQPALDGVRTVYYLIHNMSLGRGYVVPEREAARSFAAAAAAAGVRHIIYLGGLADPQGRIAAHLRSRIETGAALATAGVPVTEFRAGAIVGAGSPSFEMIRFISEQFPILPGPRWLRNRTQPIAATNVIHYLLAALEPPSGGIYEIGGPEVMTYAESMRRYAHMRGLRRAMVLLPGLPVDFMAWIVDRLTPVPFRIARALVEGLRADSIVRDDSALKRFDSVRPLAYEQAMHDVLEAAHPDRVECVWAPQAATSLRHEGFLIDPRGSTITARPATVWAALGRPPGFEVESAVPNQRLLLYKAQAYGGRQWLEWKLAPHAHRTQLTLTSYYAGRGLVGHMLWNTTRPLRLSSLQHWFQRTRKRAMEIEGDA